MEEVRAVSLVRMPRGSSLPEHVLARPREVASVLHEEHEEDVNRAPGNVSEVGQQSQRQLLKYFNPRA